VTRAELRWVLIASLIVLVFASLPTVYGWMLGDADHVFTGFVYNTEDGNSYIAKMRLGARGEWLFHLFYTAEPHDPAFVYSFYLLLGKLGAGLGLSMVLTYHIARVLLGLCLLLTVYFFVARFTSDLVTRRLAWGLVAVGSGLGWVLTLLGLTHWLGNLPLDYYVPEAYLFLVLYNLPHLALAESLLLWVLLWALRAFGGGGLRWCGYAAAAVFVMSWIAPFYAGVLAAALGAYLLGLLVRRRRFPWRETGLTALIGLGALLPVAYNAWVFAVNPAFATWAEQNLILSPHPAHYLLGFALLLVPAVWGAIKVIRDGDERWLLPVAWILAVPILLYLPFNLQRRMIAAVQVPLALLAAVGLVAWVRARRWILVAFVAVASLSNLLLVLGNLGPIQQRTTPIFRPGNEVAALEWLDAHSQPGEVVLASFEVGNVIPARTDLRVFAGHGPETLHNAEKLAALQRFFDPDTDDAWRQSLLGDYDLDYVFYGPDERELGGWDPATAVYLTPIHESREYAIYGVSQVRRQP
jgi:hypothetical protein